MAAEEVIPLVSDSRKRKIISERRTYIAIWKLATHRTACTVDGELQHSIEQALSEQISTPGVTTAALDKTISGLSGEQKRMAWCAQVFGLHRGEDSPRSVRRFRIMLTVGPRVSCPFSAELCCFWSGIYQVVMIFAVRILVFQISCVLFG